MRFVLIASYGFVLNKKIFNPRFTSVVQFSAKYLF